MLVFRFADNAKAEEALKAAGYITLTEEEVSEAAK